MSLLTEFEQGVDGSEFAEEHPERSESWQPRLHYVRRDYAKSLDLIVAAGSRPDYLTSLYKAMNERERLGALADSLRLAFEARLDGVIKAQGPPTFLAFAHAYLGNQYAILGDREAAIHEAEMAVEALQMSTDAINYPRLLLNVAVIYVRTGDYDQAIDRLETMLSIPHPWTTARLRLDPDYDPLRTHPRFQALLEKYE